MQIEVANFRSAQTRGMFEEAVRLHVLGSNSALDRQLRGVATAGVTPAALRLPPGEAVLRSYACALYSLLRNHRGALHVCRSLLLFSGHEDAHRTIIWCALCPSCVNLLSSCTPSVTQETNLLYCQRVSQVGVSCADAHAHAFYLNGHGPGSGGKERGSRALSIS